MRKLIWDKDFINKVICGDCLEIMKGIPGKSVDLIVTDPPYFETNHFADVDLVKITKELHRITQENCFLVSDFFRPAITRYINSYCPFIYYDMMTNFVSNSMANCSLGIDRFTPSLILKKGNPKVKKKWSNVIQTTRNSHKKEWSGHPTQKNLEYYKKIVSIFTEENDIVLDPFLGSGTTAVACKELGRKFIGIEIFPEYCKIAEERLKSTKRDSKQLNL